jgi:hypothetical protein
MVMMKESKIKGSVNKLQQLQWKELGKKDDHVKEG